MSSLVFLVPLALLLGGAALAAFLWSLRSGQYDDCLLYTSRCV